MSRVKIKICGLTRAEDAAIASELGAWALGFIFYSESPRYVSPIRVQKIISSLYRPPVKTVGVFVNPTLDELKEVMSQAQINTIQLHGNESKEFCQSVRQAFLGIEIIKAVRLNQDQGELEADYQLVDSISDQEWGGTGKTVDWKKAALLTGKPLILAGGLNAENIAQAISEVSPFAVDVSSGVEQKPGVKSEQKLRDFFLAAGYPNEDKELT